MELLKSKVGRLRIIAFLEGLSLLLLIFIAMPLKYIWNSPFLVEAIGPVHGVLFLLFVLLAIAIAVEYRLKFITTALVLLSSFVPFGTFIADHKVFKKL